MSNSPRIRFASLTTPSATIKLGWKSRRLSFRKNQNTWIVVHGDITCPEGAWTFADQSLMIEEVEQLTAWLRALAAGSPRPRLDFIESNLEFTTPDDANAPHTPDTVPLHIRFRGEVAPPWLWHDPELVWKTGYTLSLNIRPDQIESFAAALGQLIGR